MQRNNDREKDIICGNCGAIGHSYRRCTAPITSLGAIIYKIDNGVKYLMIQRKDTLGFVEFMRGKYNIENIKYIYKIFEIMTEKERNVIESNDFDEIWNTLWMNKTIKQYRNEYDVSKKKFNKLKNGVKVDNEHLDLKKINRDTKCYWKTPEWGFPKGRRNLKESDYNCANRELKEETGIKGTEYQIYNDIKPLEEVFLGSNNIRYKHIYYLGKANDDCSLIVDNNNIEQITEISNIAWFSLDEALRRIRPYNKEKKEVLIRADKIIKNL
jgi:8-oxo-dGTP pyrophosphatase MutT (NUDIX family)